jgi:putative spermidine/putrescine transport system substrate-binding protein
MTKNIKMRKRGRLSRVGSIILTGLVLLICIDQAACSAQIHETKLPLQEIGAGEGRLDIIAWDGDIERGRNDPRFDWVTEFEKQTGCDVNVKPASSSDEMVILMNQGGYDLVTAAGDASLRLIKSGNVQPLNTALLPSWDSIDSRFMNSPWHTINGIHYGIPFLWTTSRLMYDSDVFSTPPQGWDVLFEEQTLPDGQSNKNRMQAYEGPMAIADAALYLMKTRPDLGIKDPYELNRDQFGEAIRVLRSQRNLVSGYWPDSASQIASYSKEENAISTSWPYQIVMLQRSGKPVKSVTPGGEVTGRADSFMLHSDAAHPNCAYLWMEHVLNPKVQGDAAAWTGSNPSVVDACTSSELLGEKGCELNGYNDFENVFFWKTPVEDCGDGNQNCVPYSDWVTAYIAIVGRR